MKTHRIIAASAAVLALGINGAAFAAQVYPPVPTPKPTIAETPADICEIFYSYSYQIMLARQNGVPLPKMIEINHNNDGMRADVMALFDRVIMSAYDEPRFSTPEIQERVSVDFGNDFYLACLKGFTK